LAKKAVIKSSNSRYKNRFFESPPLAGFQKNDFGVSKAEGSGNTKIGFIVKIICLKVCHRGALQKLRKTEKDRLTSHSL